MDAAEPDTPTQPGNGHGMPGSTASVARALVSDYQRSTAEFLTTPIIPIIQEFLNLRWFRNTSPRECVPRVDLASVADGDVAAPTGESWRDVARPSSVRGLRGCCLSRTVAASPRGP